MTLDDGNPANRQAAEASIRQAGNAKDDSARKLLEQAIQLDPENAGAHNNLAWFLATSKDVRLRDPQNAVEHAAKAVQAEPDNGGYQNDAHDNHEHVCFTWGGDEPWQMMGSCGVKFSHAALSSLEPRRSGGSNLHFLDDAK